MNTASRHYLFAAALVFAGILSSATTHAQNNLALSGQLTLAPADVGSSSGDGAGDDVKDEQAELAKKLNNPVANLISVPIQNNWDFGIGPADAMKYTANIQPVVPLRLTED
jgi:hypothetical protein